MPDFTCGVDDIQTATDCSDNPGLLYVFAALDADIDWVTMAESANFDDDTNTVLEWAMEASGEWKQFTFERKNGRLDSTYTLDTGYYDNQLTALIFKGKTPARTITLAQLAACCGVVLSVYSNNSTARVLGKEFISGAWVDPLERTRISRYLDTTGAFGNKDDTNRDEVDFAGQTSTPMPYSSVTIAEMQAL